MLGALIGVMTGTCRGLSSSDKDSSFFFLSLSLLRCSLRCFSRFFLTLVEKSHSEHRMGNQDTDGRGSESTSRGEKVSFDTLCAVLAEVDALLEVEVAEDADETAAELLGTRRKCSCSEEDPAFTGTTLAFTTLCAPFMCALTTAAPVPRLRHRLQRYLLGPCALLRCSSRVAACFNCRPQW